jgi:thiamine biosynthesis lipoprotein
VNGQGDQQQNEEPQHRASIALSRPAVLTSVNLYTARMRFLLLFFMMFMWEAHAARIVDARPLMGTLVEVIAEGPEEPALRRAAEAAFQEMQRLTAMMSHYDANSVVSAINRQAGIRPVPVPPELAEVLALARRVSERTGGAFDVTVGGSPIDYRRLELGNGRAFLAAKGMKIDPGGIAKLYILEAGRRVLEAGGVRRALVNGGGDVVAHSDGAPWRVGVRDPRAPGQLLGTVALERGAVASSGDYERPGHVLDPRTGRAAEGVRGVTLVAGSVEAVNGLGPAIMVLGAPAGKKLIEDEEVEGLVVDAAGGVWTSRGLDLKPAR